MITNILQLSQIMRSYNRSKITIHNLHGENTFHRLSHHRIQTIKGFITQQILGVGANPQKHRYLFFHSLGKGIQSPPHIQTKFLNQFFKSLFIKTRIKHTIIFHHFFRCGIGKIILIIGNKKYFSFHFFIFKHFLSIYQHGTFICLQNPCHNPQTGTFSCAIGSHQTKYTSLPYYSADLGKSLNLVKLFTNAFHLNH